MSETTVTDTPVAPETVKPSDALELAIKVTHGYMNALETRWKPGLVFTPAGLARAASVFGWLAGLYQGGTPVETVNALADDFVSNLNYLANYGGKVDFAYTKYNGEPATVQVPAYTVELGDDGGTHGFTVLWHRALVTPELLEKWRGIREIRTFDRWPEVPHAFAFDGGLIYHGPGRYRENFTVSLDRHPQHFWGVHT